MHFYTLALLLLYEKFRGEYQAYRELEKRKMFKPYKYEGYSPLVALLEEECASRSCRTVMVE